MQGVNQTIGYDCEEMRGRADYLRVAIDVDPKKYADFTDSSDETLRYIMGQVTTTVPGNGQLMQRLVAFVLCRAVSGQTAR
ncbi:MAG TPA: hypothetical protein VF646_08150 [Cytophagales bacterium]